jgi:hypothetical protein
MVHLGRLEQLLENRRPQQTESVKHNAEDATSHAQQARVDTSFSTEHVDNDVAWLEKMYDGECPSVNTTWLEQ